MSKRKHRLGDDTYSIMRRELAAVVPVEAINQIEIGMALVDEDVDVVYCEFKRKEVKSGGSNPSI
jgi:hypothetical protein